MLTNEEVQMVLKLRDEATAEWKRASEEFKKSTKGMSDSVVDASGKLRTHGKETTTLTGWMREQMREQRQQNFLFNQGKEVVAAGSTVLALFSNTAGNSSKQMRQLSDTLNDGFTTFQGLGNVLGFLPGPIGMTVAALGGIAVIIRRITSDSEVNIAKMNELKGKYEELLIAAGKLPETIKFNTMTAEIILAEAEVKRLQSATTDYIKTGLNIMSGRGTIVSKTVGTPEEIQEAKNNVLSLQNQLDTFTKGFIDKKGLQNESFVGWLTQGSNTIPLVQRDIRSVLSTSKEFRGSLGNVRKAIMDIKPISYQSFKGIVEDMRQAQEASNILFSSMTIGFEAAFAGAAGAGKTFIKSFLKGFIDMVQGMIFAAEAAALAKAVSTWGTTLIADLPKLAAATAALQWAKAFVNRSFHTGGSAFINAPAGQEVPIMVRGQEDIVVRTPEQRQGGSSPSSVTVNVHINAPIDRYEWIRDGVVEGLRASGLKHLNQLFTDEQGQLVTVAS